MPRKPQNWIKMNIPESCGFYTDHDFASNHRELYADLLRKCAKACKCSAAQARKAFYDVRHPRQPCVRYQVVPVLSTAEAAVLASKILSLHCYEQAFYDGAPEDNVSRFVYLKHPTVKAYGAHLLKDDAVVKAIENCRAALRGILLSGPHKKQHCGLRRSLATLKPLQVFANVYPPGECHYVPWHKDVDTVCGSAVLILQGSGEDYFEIGASKGKVETLAPAPGNAVLMMANVEHHVPMRVERTEHRVTLIIWF